MKSCTELGMLAKYIRGSLSKKDMDRLEEHISVCDACLEEFVVANSIMRDKELSEWEPVSKEAALSLLDVLNNKIRHFYEWITALPSELMLTPDFAPVRSDAGSPVDYVYLSKHMGELQTEMYVEKTAHDKVCFHARVFKENLGAKNVRLTFIRDEDAIVSRLLKDDYELFENMLFGSYCLTVRQNAMEKGSYHFEILPEGVGEK